MCVLPKFWEALCHILGLEELIADARFKSPGDRRKNRDALMELYDAVTRTRTTAEWMECFVGQVPAAPVLSMEEALDNAYLEEIDGIASIEHPEKSGSVAYGLNRHPARRSVATATRSWPISAMTTTPSRVSGRRARSKGEPG